MITVTESNVLTDYKGLEVGKWYLSEDKLEAIFVLEKSLGMCTYMGVRDNKIRHLIEYLARGLFYPVKEVSVNLEVKI